MKIRWLAIPLVACGAAWAQTVFINGVDVQGQGVRGVGLVNLDTNLNLSCAPSVGQLMGIDPASALPLTNPVYLLPLCVLSVDADEISARTAGGLTFYDGANHAVLTIKDGQLWGSGGSLSNLNAAALTGRLSANALPTGGVWLATGVTISNAVLHGNASALTGLTAEQVGVNYYTVTDDETAVGNAAHGRCDGAALGRSACGYNFGVAIGAYSYGPDGGVALGSAAHGDTFGTAVGFSADGSFGGVGIGSSARGAYFSVAVGTQADGTDYGAVVGAAASGTSGGAVVGFFAFGDKYGAAVGYQAHGTDHGTAVGGYSIATNFGVALGYTAQGSNKGVALGLRAVAQGQGNVALGGAAEGWDPATVPDRWADTVELGRGMATLQGGLNFRGYGIVNGSGVIVAPISTSNLVVTTALTLTNATVNLTGASITGLTASQITAGRLAADRLPAGGVWDASGLTATNLNLAWGAGNTPGLAQILKAGNNGDGLVLSNVVVYGSGAGLTALPAESIAGLGSAAFSNTLAFAAAAHTHAASQISGGHLACAMLPYGGAWDAGGLVASNLTIVGGNTGAGYAASADGLFTNLTVAGSAAVSNLTVAGNTTLAMLTVGDCLGATHTVITNVLAGVTIITYIPAQGDLVMGSYTNQP